LKTIYRLSKKDTAKPSKDFYQSFQAGEAGDRMDVVEWASIFQMVERLRSVCPF